MEAARRGRQEPQLPVSRQRTASLTLQRSGSMSAPPSFNIGGSPPSCTESSEKCQILGNIRTWLEQAEAAAEDLRAITEPLPADAISDLHALQERLGRVLHQIEEKQVKHVHLED